jgi:hypothetical protein
MISAELLDEKIRLLKDQEMQHFALYHQARGAIDLAEHLKSKLGEKDHLTLEELGEVVGGKVESIDPV